MTTAVSLSTASFDYSKLSQLEAGKWLLPEQKMESTIGTVNVSRQIEVGSKNSTSSYISALTTASSLNRKAQLTIRYNPIGGSGLTGEVHLRDINGADVGRVEFTPGENLLVSVDAGVELNQNELGLLKISYDSLVAFVKCPQNPSSVKARPMLPLYLVL